ncbi:MAG: ABC transporter ATP-binding protein [Chitinophagaceae bacterium]|jgi:lipopolysaccharide transport system ATP-binding protein|nr:ABC transporter ATP-binding protein [Chitinophagaceae bacterium]MBP6416045.1 ABC transporter ATP-binding protein [Chitinophagaceae bacterium]HQW43792.1 ABC transporter ATP-binding protein [Chitinophagaceae bacterium]
MKPAIEIRNLGKEYKLAPSQPYVALRDILSNGAKNLFKARKEKEKFWALQDINLDIQPGERVGIIGRNGAGKSTLLKIISRITPPTTGSAIIRGRVGSLLEVGTGFHPELTGRENIYLNGSILGLKKAEINKQLDAIIDFSGVEKFIDTPLKHYSSGMQLRLAFSVAAHLEPEILLIDEVLAVGDAEFQKKCIGKMEEVSKSHGRTIMFVSHNLDSLRKFCSTTILLNGGRLIEKGNTEKMISLYVSKHLETNAEMYWEQGIESYNKEVVLYKTWLHDENGVIRSIYDTTEKLGISMDYQVMKDNVPFTHGINVYNQEQVNIFNSHDVTTGNTDRQKKKGRYTATVWIPGNLLPEGIFNISVAIFLPNPLDVLIHEQNKLSFEMHTDYSKLSARGTYSDDFPGVIRPLLNWELIKND